MNDLVAPRKILFSPGFGAGWTSWHSDEEVSKFALEYKPIIEFLEKGGLFVENRNGYFGYKEDSTYKALKAMATQKDQSPNEAEIAERKARNFEALWRFQEPGRAILSQFLDDIFEKFGEEYFFLGGARDLEVLEVHGRVRIHEYDGNESVEQEGSFQDWL